MRMPPCIVDTEALIPASFGCPADCRFLGNLLALSYAASKYFIYNLPATQIIGPRKDLAQAGSFGGSFFPQIKLRAGFHVNRLRARVDLNHRGKCLTL